MDKKEIQRIYEDKKKGISFSELEERYNVNRSAINYVLKGYEAGLKTGRLHGFSISDIVIGIGIGVLIASLIVMIFK